MVTRLLGPRTAGTGEVLCYEGRGYGYEAGPRTAGTGGGCGD